MNTIVFYTFNMTRKKGVAGGSQKYHSKLNRLVPPLIKGEHEQGNVSQN